MCDAQSTPSHIIVLDFYNIHTEQNKTDIINDLNSTDDYEEEDELLEELEEVEEDIGG